MTTNGLDKRLFLPFGKQVNGVYFLLAAGFSYLSNQSFHLPCP